MAIDDAFKNWSAKPGDLKKAFEPAANPQPPGKEDASKAKTGNGQQGQVRYAPAPGMRPQPPRSVGREVDLAADAERRQKLIEQEDQKRRACVDTFDKKGAEKSGKDAFERNAKRDIFNAKAAKDGKG